MTLLPRSLAFFFFSHRPLSPFIPLSLLLSLQRPSRLFSASPLSTLSLSLASPFSLSGSTPLRLIIHTSESYYNDTPAAPTVWHTTLLIFFPRFHRFQPEFSAALCKHRTPRSFTRPCTGFIPSPINRTGLPAIRDLTAVVVRYPRGISIPRYSA